MIDPQIKFSRVRKGYSPQEVDAVFDEFLRQNGDLKNQLKQLGDTVGKYDGKIEQLTLSTKRLEEERIKESLRMSGVMNVAARVAEQIEQEAKIKAEQIIQSAQTQSAEIIEQAKIEAERILAQARRDAEAARYSLTRLSENTHNIRLSNERYFSDANRNIGELDELLSQLTIDPSTGGGFEGDYHGDALDELQSYQDFSSQNQFAINDFEPQNSFDNEELKFDGSEFQISNSELSDDTSDFDPYEEFLKEAGLTEQNPESGPHYLPKSEGKFLGHFGD